MLQHDLLCYEITQKRIGRISYVIIFSINDSAIGNPDGCKGPEQHLTFMGSFGGLIELFKMSCMGRRCCHQKYNDD